MSMDNNTPKTNADEEGGGAGTATNDNNNNIGTPTPSQLSLDQSTATSRDDSQSQQSSTSNGDNNRSRNNSDMSHDLSNSMTSSADGYNNNNNNQSSGQSAGSLFFADITLDINLAQMETTPRTDMKFASMAVGGGGSREELIRNVPSMPLIEEPNVATMEEDGVNGIGAASGADVAAGGSGLNHNIMKADEFDSMEAAAAQPTSTIPTAPPPRSFARIESSTTPGGVNDSFHTYNNSSTHSSSTNNIRPSRPPRRPRDVSWTAAALIIMPLGLFIPHVYYSNGYIVRHNTHPCHPDNIHVQENANEGGGATDEYYLSNEYCHPHHPSWSQMALSPSTHSTILFSSLAATAISLALLRLLYNYPGGGEGDDRRHVNVTRTLLLASNLCVLLNPLLVIILWYWLPNIRVATLLPLSLIVRDVFRVKNSGSSLPSFRNVRTLDGRIDGRMAFHRRTSAGAGGGGGGVGSNASSSHDRKTFFRALAVAALDILSRSLRRRSFVRVASVLLIVQLICVSLWWGAFSVILSVEIFDEDGIVTKFMHTSWIFLTLVAGKWATGTIARLLGFVASGGVASWFGRQSVIIELMEREQAEEEERQRQQWQLAQPQQSTPNNKMTMDESTTDGDAATGGEDSSNADSGVSDDPASGYSSNYAAAQAARSAMPDAYATADASAYTSVMDFDEGLDDDYEDDDEEGISHPSRPMGSPRHGNMNSSMEFTSTAHQSTSTVKSFLTAGCTFSFGSVAQCGLLGGLAQYLWSLVRNIDAMGFFLQRRFATNDSRGFRGMDIGRNSNHRQWKQKLAVYWRKLDVSIRAFVRSHSDLAMSHCAAYFKSYQRAANDVAVLIEATGMLLSTRLLCPFALIANSFHLTYRFFTCY